MQTRAGPGVRLHWLWFLGVWHRVGGKGRSLGNQISFSNSYSFQAVRQPMDCCFSLGPLSFQSPTPNTLVPPGPLTLPTAPAAPVHRCNSNSCFRGVRCTDTRDGFQCGPCPEGYTGNGIACSDIDEVKLPWTGWGLPKDLASPAAHGKRSQADGEG